MSPWRVRPLCGAPGCTNRQPCALHPPPVWVKRRHESTKARGYSGRHVQWRIAVLAAHPRCPCGSLATVADHIIALRDGGDWALTNGQGLCRRCHARKSQREGQRRGG